MLEGQADVVEPLEQAVAAEGIDGERPRESAIIADLAGPQVDRQPVRMACGLGGRSATKKFVDVSFIEFYRQHAVLEAVVEENIGEGRGDHRAESIVVKGPGGVFTARATAEVATGQEDACPLTDRLIEFEGRIRGSVRKETPVEEEELPEPGALDPLQELLGDDLVGIDVGTVEGGDVPGVGRERLHGGGTPSGRGDRSRFFVDGTGTG